MVRGPGGGRMTLRRGHERSSYGRAGHASSIPWGVSPARKWSRAVTVLALGVGFSGLSLAASRALKVPFSVGVLAAFGGLVIAAFAAIGIVLLALIVFLVVDAPRSKRRRRHALAKLAALPCPACGTPFGEEGVAVMDRENGDSRRRALETAFAEGFILRLDPRWHVGCPRCGARLVCDVSSGSVALDRPR